MAATLIILIVACVHVALCLAATKTLLQGNLLTTKQKRYNLVFLWLIPFVWYLIIKIIYKRVPGSHETNKLPGSLGSPFYGGNDGMIGSGTDLHHD